MFVWIFVTIRCYKSNTTQVENHKKMQMSYNLHLKRISIVLMFVHFFFCTNKSIFKYKSSKKKKLNIMLSIN